MIYKKYCEIVNFPFSNSLVPQDGKYNGLMTLVDMLLRFLEVVMSFF